MLSRSRRVEAWLVRLYLVLAARRSGLMPQGRLGWQRLPETMGQVRRNHEAIKQSAN
jgi:hypothetical protein